MPPEIPARLSDVFVRVGDVTMVYPYGAARDGYVVDSDERLARLIALAWDQVPTTSAWTLRFFGSLLVAPFLLFALDRLSWPAILALLAATSTGWLGWSVYRLRGRIAPLVNGLPRAPARAVPVWTPLRSFPWPPAAFGFVFTAALTVTAAHGPLAGVTIFVVGAATAALGLAVAARLVLQAR